MTAHILNLIAFIVFITCPSYLLAQQQSLTEIQHLAEHKPLMSKTWETFDMLMYKVTKKDGQTIYTPHFPPQLAALDGKTVQLQGYMVPLKAGYKHNTFMLSVLPIQQCMFCGQNGIPAMVEVTLTGGTKKRIYETPITVKGKTILNSKQNNRLEIWITEAIIVE